MKTIILCGKSGAGKNTVGLELEKLGVKKIVTYTTRPMRPREVNGVDYNFVTEEEFQKLLDDGKFAETASYNAEFGFCRYGSLKESYGQDNTYIILNPIGLKAVRNAGADALAVYLRVDENKLIKRLKKRGDKPEEIIRRLAADAVDFADIEVDLIIDNANDPKQVAETICEFAKEW